MKKYKHDFLSINKWVNEHSDSAFWVWHEIIHGLRKYGLDREKVVKYMCICNENWMLMFEILWSMLLQVDPRTVNKYYPRPRSFPYPWVT